MRLLSVYRGWALCPLLVLLVAQALSLPAGATSIRVVTHPDVSEQSLGNVALQNIFTLRDQRWPDGQAIRVVTLPDLAPAHQQFCRQLLGVFPHQLRRIWDRRVFSGLAQAPLEAKDEPTLRRLVASTPGAIGYLLHEPSNEGVRLVPFP